MIHKNLIYFFFLFVLIDLAARVILVTGVAGFIGRHLAKKLLLDGDTVIGIDNFAVVPYNNYRYSREIKKKRILKLQKKFSNQFFFYESNIINKKELEEIFQSHSIDIVCHLAGLGNVRYSLENPELYIQYIIQGTVTVLEAMRKFGVFHMVLASSSSVYGETTEKKFTENSNPNLELKSPYALAKYSAELYCKMYYLLYNINVTCLRLFTVYGPYSRIDMSPYLFLDAIYREKELFIMGDGLVKRDFTFIGDVVNGFLKALEKPLGYQVINIGSGSQISLIDFIKKIETIVGKKASLCYQKFNASDLSFTCADLKKANELLGYQPQYSLDNGLQLLYEWYLSENLKLNTV